MRANRLIPLGLPALLAACASTPGPTPQLQTARQAYVTAANGPASRLAPETLRSAKHTLDLANRANVHGDDDQVEWAQLATSRASLATARGNAVIALQQRDAATKSLTDAVAQRPNVTGVTERQAELERRQRELERRLGQTNVQPAPSHGLLHLADRQEPAPGGGTALVITRGLEFATGSAKLSEAAQLKLDRVARALNAEPNRSETKLNVDGFTDSTGSDAVNQRLSEQRAQRVTRYLERRGVASDRITTNGQSSGDPVGNNQTVSGRARNRRVEILVMGTGAAGTSAPTNTQPGQPNTQPGQPNTQPGQQNMPPEQQQNEEPQPQQP